MAVNPTDWLSSTMQACCQKFFGGFQYDKCMGRYPPDQDDCNVMLHYPDWNGANEGCASDGKQRLLLDLDLDIDIACAQPHFSHTSSYLFVFVSTNIQAKSRTTC